MSESVEIRRDRLLHGRLVSDWVAAPGECFACSLGQYLQQRPDYPKEQHRRAESVGLLLSSLRWREEAATALDAIGRYNDELLRHRVVLAQPETTPKYEAQIILCFAQMGTTATFTGEYVNE